MNWRREIQERMSGCGAPFAAREPRGGSRSVGSAAAHVRFEVLHQTAARAFRDWTRLTMPLLEAIRNIWKKRQEPRLLSRP